MPVGLFACLTEFSRSYRSFSNAFQMGVHGQREGRNRIMLIFLYLSKSKTLYFYCEYTEKKIETEQDRLMYYTKMKDQN